MINVILLAVGFLLLVKGAGFLVEGAANMSRRLGISSLIIGLTVVAFGTSMPELMVSVLAAIRGSSAIALGNVIGSNFANIGLILGLSAMIMPLKVAVSTIWKEIPLALAAAVIVMLVAFDTYVAEGQSDLITFRDGLILLIFFIIFLVYTFSLARSQNHKFSFSHQVKETVHLERHMQWRFITIYIIAGIAMVSIGGEFVVRNSVVLANRIGLSEAFIGSTIIAVGTSLPELVTSVIAAYRKQSDIAVGNIVGSNIFNALFILGVASLISPLQVDAALWRDGIFMIGITALLWLFSGIRHQISRTEGAVLFICYWLYIAFITFRQGILG